MKKTDHAIAMEFWSKGAAARNAAELREAQSQTKPPVLAFEAEGRYYAGRMNVPVEGTLVLQAVSPRSLRIWLNDNLVLDEEVFWRHYQREIRAVITYPCQAGHVDILVEVGKRFIYHEWMDKDMPSRNRPHVIAEVHRQHPDRLDLTGHVVAGIAAPAASFLFSPAQFVRDGVAWQHLLVRPIRGFFAAPPSNDHWSPLEVPEPPLSVQSSVLPRMASDGTTVEERKAGRCRFHVPVAEPNDMPAPRRKVGVPEIRVEPVVEIARTIDVTVEGPGGSVSFPMPAYESTGRLAPHREFREIHWPTFEEARSRLPSVVLPARWERFGKLYDAAWNMLFGLVRRPRPESGLPNAYISTGSNFPYHQFVWDTSFAAMATAYGCRVIPYEASMNILYVRQFDGGYIPRENDVRDNLPALYEPDFSPNPPIMSVAEWAMVSLTGDIMRLRRVYPALAANHQWLVANRRLPNGTFWTTGLANGLDNSPSLGDGYPCLTAQMAHDAETLSKMAAALGLEREADAWRAEYQQIGEALNAHLWSESMQIYSTSLPDGGHNPNKVVTAFWPLWAGIVPPDRVAALARHLKDPKSFWRHHPIPSLAADSPHFKPEGNYWLGSTWAPTNHAAIKGLARAGRSDLALETTERHLQCMLDVLNDTGKIWENYCSEGSRKGSWSAPDYCWSAAGPIALLIEVVIGIEVDALNRTIFWRPPANETLGIRNLPLGSAAVSLTQRFEGECGWVDVETDSRFTLRYCGAHGEASWVCPPGRSTYAIPKASAG
jgi:hypothetical protein